MNHQPFATFVRRATSALSSRDSSHASRRDVARALTGLTLGAGWATLRGIDDGEAKKKNKNKAKNNAKKKAKQRCEKQGQSCREFGNQLCALFHPTGPLRAPCEQRAEACCSPLEQCNGGEYFACLLDHLEDLIPV